MPVTNESLRATIRKQLANSLPELFPAERHQVAAIEFASVYDEACALEDGAAAGLWTMNGAEKTKRIMQSSRARRTMKKGSKAD